MEEFDMPEKLRFSLWTVEELFEELKSCVMVGVGVTRISKTGSVQGPEAVTLKSLGVLV